MSYVFMLLLLAVTSVAVTNACLCKSNCQWTKWSNVGSCRASCGAIGTQRKHREEIQRGTCSKSRCYRSQASDQPCISPCVNGIATGLGCQCPDTYTGTCCELEKPTPPPSPAPTEKITTPIPTPSDKDRKCTIRAGTCEDDSTSCDGVYWTGFCSGGKTRRCCIPGSVTKDNKCIDEGGHCQSNDECVDGDYKKHLCDGNAKRMCCILDAPVDPTESRTAFKCEGLTIVSRKQWGAAPSRGLSPLKRNPAKILFIHHVGAGTICKTDCAKNVKSIQREDLKKAGYKDISYNYLVGDDGKAYVGRDWGSQGGHTWGYNDIAYGICAIGDFTSDLASDKLVQTLRKLIACAEEQGILDKGYEIFGHRDGGLTECPGKNLYDAIKKFPNFSTRKIPKFCFKCTDHKKPKQNKDKKREK